MATSTGRRKGYCLFSILWSIVLVFLKSDVLGQDGSSTNAMTTTDVTTEEIRTSPPTDNITSPSSSNTTRSTMITQSILQHDTDCYECPDNLNCQDLGAECLNCSLNESCIYGREYNVTCRPKCDNIICHGNRTFQRNFKCRYCFQTDDDEQICTPAIKSQSSPQCRVSANPLEIITVNCTVLDVICLGQRQFYKRKPCNWTSGHKHSVALILSITLGGFGADRFYLGYWKEALGKFFSFGGIGVWTLVDVIMIAVGYVGPADGSHYI